MSCGIRPVSVFSRLISTQLLPTDSCVGNDGFLGTQTAWWRQSAHGRKLRRGKGA